MLLNCVQKKPADAMLAPLRDNTDCALYCSRHGLHIFPCSADKKAMRWRDETRP